MQQVSEGSTAVAHKAQAWPVGNSFGLTGETLIFFLASGLDYLLTRYLLLGFGNASRIGHITEANPVARYFLYNWGFSGLVYFKASMVLLVAVICQVIAVRRLDVARRLLVFATMAVLTVVMYSVQMLIRHS